MKKTEQYRQTLKTLEDWDAFLLKESGLPGPRANLELAQVVADEGHEALFRRWLLYDAAAAPANFAGRVFALLWGGWAGAAFGRGPK
jgi:hypothetical protein